METNNKYLVPGIIIAVLVIVIIIILAVRGSKKPEVIVTPASTTTTQTTTTTPATNTVPDSKVNPKVMDATVTNQSIVVAFPTKSAILTRGKAYDIKWSGAAECYDVSYALSATNATSSSIGKACQDASAGLELHWTVPLNIKPGNYIIRFAGQGAGASSGTSATFIIN
jgi:hypothetical protein